jgi:hypothetical protein
MASLLKTFTFVHVRINLWWLMICSFSTNTHIHIKFLPAPWGIWRWFSPAQWEIWPKFFRKVKFPGVRPGGMIAVGIDWYIIVVENGVFLLLLSPIAGKEDSTGNMVRTRRKQASFSNLLFLIASFVFIEFDLFEFIWAKNGIY